MTWLSHLRNAIFGRNDEALLLKLQLRTLHNEVMEYRLRSAFAFGILKALVDRETLYPEDASAICRFVADVARDAKDVDPEIADSHAKKWDDVAIIFQPREPGPRRPGYERMPDLDPPIGPIRPSKRPE